MSILNLGYIKFILQTAFCMFPLAAGLALLLMSRERWEAIIGKLVGVNDLELSSGSIVIRRVVGGLLVVLAGLLAYVFFFPSE